MKEFKLKRRRSRWIIPLALTGLTAILLHSVKVFYVDGISSENENQLVETKSAKYADKQKRADGFRDYYRDITVPIGAENSGYETGYRLNELKKARVRGVSFKKNFSDTLVWSERGPGNVAGRARSLIVDPDDPNGRTWYAGSASGGIWKTTDGGSTWRDLTPDLPNLSTVALYMAPGNHDVIYAGTGEGVGNVGAVMGDGIFISIDRGENWEQIQSTAGNSNFRYVNKLWVDPEDEDIVIAATNRGIYKTTDRGGSWSTVFPSIFPVQDMRPNPENPNTLYAGVNSIGIIKSTDRGDSWKVMSKGIGNGLRFSLDVSPVDTSIIFTSVQTPEETVAVYISEDAGQNWRIHDPLDENFINFHGIQGWFNNAIIAHPIDAKKVFIGGVYLGLVEFTDQVSQSDPVVTRVDTFNTAGFLDFINFGSDYLGGGMSTGLDEEADVLSSDFVSVEMRFGPGKSQMAHRFLVPDGQGAGVPSADYTYQDYVTVPFEVWDVKNNRQLMVSFRDQERDGEFNLIIRDPFDEISGREYIFVSAYDYNSNTPQPEIVNSSGNNKGGHYSKLLYFFWPTLADETTWDPDALGESSLLVDYGRYELQGVNTTIISSNVVNTELHVDHHDLQIIPVRFFSEDFQMISANDGGVGYSGTEGRIWRQVSRSMITGQFYGVSKRPGKDEFIGGMQDNGTQKSPKGRTANRVVRYESKLGGDGFQTLWHPNGLWILASIYENDIYRSSDGGETWESTSFGIDGDGPFITKLSHNRDKPNTVFAIGAKGVYKNTDFGRPTLQWELTEIDEGLRIGSSLSSAANVKVSLANPDLVWAGSGMYDDPVLDIYFSSTGGETFFPVTRYTAAELGYISGMETHPTDEATAYLLFSYSKKPKILRTVDYGDTWEDISGFESSDTSTNGFPDVTVNCLLVMPHDPDVIWAGTEIGIVESIDNGESWHLLDTDLPNVAIFQMFFQDGQIVVATHGRGIWTASNEAVYIGDQVIQDAIELFPNPAMDRVYLTLPSVMDEEVTINLYTVNGRHVMSEQRMVRSYDQTLELSVGDLVPGSYFLEVSGNNIRVSEHLLIK